MLSYEDAWANIKMFMEPDDTSNKGDMIEELELAIKALDKQVSKTPKLNGEYGFIRKTKTYTCPCCGNVLLTRKMNSRQDTSFCWDCGQRLNWSNLE